VLGVSPHYSDIRNLIVTVGRFLDETDNDAHIKCAVVTEIFAKERYGSPDAAVGQTFEISGIPFTIIGVFKESVDDFGQSEIQDQTILIPYSVARYFTGTERVNQIYSPCAVWTRCPMPPRTSSASCSRTTVPTPFTRRRRSAVADRRQPDCRCFDRRAVPGGHGHAGCGRRGHHEHHAGQRPLARARDRHSQGFGRHPPRDQAPVPIRSYHHLPDRRRRGDNRGLALPLSVRFFTSYAIPVSLWSIVVALTAATVVGVIFGTVPATRAAQMTPVESLKYE